MDARLVAEAPVQTMAISADKKCIEVTTVQKVPKTHLQQQLSQLLRQASQINAQIAKVQESLGLFEPKEEVLPKDVPQG